MLYSLILLHYGIDMTKLKPGSVLVSAPETLSPPPHENSANFKL